jgi:hypothetical protein
MYLQSDIMHENNILRYILQHFKQLKHTTSAYWNLKKQR